MAVAERSGGWKTLGELRFEKQKRLHTCLHKLGEHDRISTGVVPERGFDQYTNYARNSIQTYGKVHGNYCVNNTNALIRHYKYCHRGLEVLSTSKYLFNQILELAEDLTLSLHYQNTDSMHNY